MRLTIGWCKNLYFSKADVDYGVYRDRPMNGVIPVYGSTDNAPIGRVSADGSYYEVRYPYGRFWRIARYQYRIVTKSKDRLIFGQRTKAEWTTIQSSATPQIYYVDRSDYVGESLSGAFAFIVAPSAMPLRSVEHAVNRVLGQRISMDEFSHRATSDGLVIYSPLVSTLCDITGGITWNDISEVSVAETVKNSDDDTDHASTTTEPDIEDVDVTSVPEHTEPTNHSEPTNHIGGSGSSSSSNPRKDQPRAGLSFESGWKPNFDFDYVGGDGVGPGQATSSNANGSTNGDNSTNDRSPGVVYHTAQSGNAATTSYVIEYSADGKSAKIWNATGTSQIWVPNCTTQAEYDQHQAEVRAKEEAKASAEAAAAAQAQQQADIPVSWYRQSPSSSSSSSSSFSSSSVGKVNKSTGYYSGSYSASSSFQVGTNSATSSSGGGGFSRPSFSFHW